MHIYCIVLLDLAYRMDDIHCQSHDAFKGLKPLTEGEKECLVVKKENATITLTSCGGS